MPIVDEVIEFMENEFDGVKWDTYHENEVKDGIKDLLKYDKIYIDNDTIELLLKLQLLLEEKYNTKISTINGIMEKIAINRDFYRDLSETFDNMISNLGKLYDL